MQEDREFDLIQDLKKVPDPKRLQQQMQFALEIDKEKNIFRQTHLAEHGRREDDAEHAWHMAIMAMLLQEYSNEKIDIGRTVMLCLCHDLVEIYAGDTYAYDEEGKKTQKKREADAENRLFDLLPDDQRAFFSGLFDEFEKQETAEAKFARAMDNLQPLMLNHSNGGGDWKEHGVSFSQVMGRQHHSAEGSEQLFELIDRIIHLHTDAGDLVDDRESKQ